MFRSIASFLSRFTLLTVILLSLTAGTAYYLWIHRYPYTQNAFVTANIRTVSALTAGYVEAIHVKNNMFVRKGTPLVTIYRPPYRLKAESLHHAVNSQKAAIRSLQSQISAQKAIVRADRYILLNKEYLSAQALELYSGAVYSQKKAETALREKEAAFETMTAAAHTLESLQHQLIQAQETLKDLEKQKAVAEIWFQQTVIRAETDGYVSNMHLSPGSYAAAGQSLFSFVDSGQWFIQANFEETELSEIRQGLPARIWLWQYPGKELKGVVEETGWGVERRLTDTENGMPQVQKENDWFLLPQRYPVQIRILDPPEGMLHPGGSAFVQVPVPAHPFRQLFWRLFQL